MFERTQSFEMNGNNFESIQQRVENILQNDLMYSTKKVSIGKSLSRINYFNDYSEEYTQKNNRITILKEPERSVYIQVKGQLVDEEIDKLWSELEKDLLPIVQNKKVVLPGQDMIINKVIELIKLKGYLIDFNQVTSCLNNFLEKFNRLPTDDEISSIAKGYIIMVNEDFLLEKAETSATIKSSSEYQEPVLDIKENNNAPSSYSSNTLVSENSVERRRCPNCGDEGSIHEVTDKNIILMYYPRIYGKKNIAEDVLLNGDNRINFF